MNEKANVEILACKSCGHFIVAINDRRISGHKCAGSWRVVTTEKIPVERIQEALKIDLEVGVSR